MTLPTETEIKDEIGKALTILEETRKFGHVNAQNFIGLQDALTQVLEGDWSDAAAAGVTRMRTSLDAMIREGRNVVRPLLRTYGQIINAQLDDIQEIITALYDHMVKNSLSVGTRGFTFGSPAAGGTNVGNGALLRLTVDKEGFAIEATHADAKTATCIADQSAGARKHEEVFEIASQPRQRDSILVSGAGGTATRMSGLTATQSSRVLANPSFEARAGTDATPTAITGWTVSGAGGSAVANNFALDATNYYRGHAGTTEPKALVFKAKAKAKQTLGDRRVSINPQIPYCAQVAYNAQVSGANGTLTMRLGSRSASVNVSGATGWNTLRLPLDKNLWYDNWAQNDTTFEIELSGATVYGLRVDDALLVPFSRHDNLWYAFLGGRTPWMRDDVFTWTDRATEAVIQRWLHRLEGRYLPHSGAPTWTI